MAPETINIVSRLLPLVAADRPSGFAATWETLRQFAGERALACCLGCLAELRTNLVPLSPIERSLLLEWESLLVGCIGIACHVSGDVCLANEAYRRCWNVRLTLVDQNGLRKLDILRALLDIQHSGEDRGNFLAASLDAAESAIRTLSPDDVIQRFLCDERRDIRRQALRALVSHARWDRIGAALIHPDAQTRRDAMELLDDNALKPLHEVVVARLADEYEDWVVRWSAACMLARGAHTSKANEIVHQALWAPHPLVRIAVVTALASSAGAGAEREIAAMLDDPAVEVRIAAIHALERIGSPAVISRLKEIQDQHDLLLRDPRPMASQAIAVIQERIRSKPMNLRQGL